MTGSLRETITPELANHPRLRLTTVDVQGAGQVMPPRDTRAHTVARDLAPEPVAWCPPIRTGWQVELRALLDVSVYEPEPERSVFVVTYAAIPMSEAELVVSVEHQELRLVPIREVEMLRMPDGYKRSIRSWATLPR